MPLNKSQIKEPVLAKETVNVPELGGEIIVQAMMMSDRLQVATADVPKFAHIAEVLSRSVVDDKGERIWTPQQWEVFGGSNQESAWRLFDVAKRLSKLDAGEKEKNVKAPS